MQITPALLTHLGFELLSLSDRMDTYDYKGIAGRLVAEGGLFYFAGFSQPIFKETDLRFLLMLIDYQPDESLPLFATDLN